MYFFNTWDKMPGEWHYRQQAAAASAAAMRQHHPAQQAMDNLRKDVVDLIWEHRDLILDPTNRERHARWKVKYEMLRREGVVL